MSSLTLATAGRRHGTDYVLPLDPRRPEESLFLPGEHRAMGIHIMAGKGSGKSRLMGRVISFSDLFCGVPQVVFDPLGSTIKHIIDKVSRLPADLQDSIWPRVIYIDMSGQRGRVANFPLYYRIGSESLDDMANRFLEVIARLNPQLEDAAIYGMAAVRETGHPTGVILAALGLQVTEAHHLLLFPEKWATRLQALRNEDPRAVSAVDYFLNELIPLEDARRRELTRSFRRWLHPFHHDQSMQAMFGLAPPTLDLHRVVEKQQTVLLDFGHEHNRWRRRFKTMWAFDMIFEYIKQRQQDHPTPLAVLVDEITELTSQKSAGEDVFEQDLGWLLNMYARNFNVWLTLAHQERFQLSEENNGALDGMGTQVLGVTSSRDAADELAKMYFARDPFQTKYREPIYASVSDGLGGASPVQIDWRTHFLPLNEQSEINARHFMSLRPFNFIIRPCLVQGDVSREVYEVDLSYIDRGQWPSDNRTTVSQAIDTLFSIEGLPTEQVIDLVHERQRQLPIGDDGGFDILGSDDDDPPVDDRDEDDWDTGPAD